MADYRGKLIISDLDGTFLGDHGRVVPRNVEAVRAFCRGGGRFTFATGRHHDHLLEAIPELLSLVNAPAIVANGAYMYDYPRRLVLHETFMDTDVTRQALLFARHSFPQVGFRVSTPQGFLTDGRTDYMERFIAYCAEHRADYTVEVAPVERWMQRLWYKVVFRGACEGLDALAGELREKFGDAFEYNKSSETFLELQRAGCSKGTMLRVLRGVCAGLDGVPVTAYAVGDYENDLTMLAAADVAVCPANAQPRVRELCKMVLCDHDEGAIADLIERI